LSRKLRQPFTLPAQKGSEAEAVVEVRQRRDVGHTAAQGLRADPELHVAGRSTPEGGSGQIAQSVLEERCQLTAQRLGVLYGLNSPEFFDRTMFENFIDLLRARQVILRHSILQVTHG